MKKIVICGDSYFSADLRFSGTHFSELLDCDKYINLARTGCSNTCIRLQVSRAIELSPDLIILGASDHSRLEIPLEKYIRENGLDNIEYADSHYGYNFSSTIVNQNPQRRVTMLSDHINTLSRLGYLPKNKAVAFKHFITELWDENWEQERNKFIIESSLYALQASSIQFVYMPNTNYVPDGLDKKNVFDINIKEMEKHDIGETTYHTTEKSQKQIAQKLKEFLDV